MIIKQTLKKRSLTLSLHFFLCLVLCSAGAIAQVSYNKLPVIIPASPNAAAISKYGNLDVGLQTGSANFKIPLFNVEGNKWNMPVDLQYSTSGIKVDQIASRTGMGWSLNSGGVITRSVNGKPDELKIRSGLPANWTSMGQNFMTFLEQVITEGGDLDTQPDDFFYNFNGYSGKFVLDSNRNAVCTPHANLKISFTFNSSTSSSITIKTPDGSQYFFETTEYTSASSIIAGTSQTIANSVPTSWYLSKIILPNKEQVNFSYEDTGYSYISGLSQTLTQSYDAANNSACLIQPCAVINNSESTILSSIWVFGKRLTKITFRTLTADFEYISRQDIPVSTPGNSEEKLLSRIVVKSGAEILKSMEFNYQYGLSTTNYQSFYGTEQTLRYRPYLQSVNYKGSDGSSSGKHIFTYNDINGLPPRLSYSQDMFGHFNGKLNTTFIPLPESSADRSMFWKATANRAPDLVSALKGSLIRIEYPTGGKDSIVYALNDYFQTREEPGARQSKALSIPKTSTFPQVRTTVVFSTQNPSTVTIAGNTLIEMGSDGSSPFDPATDLITVELIRQSDSQVMYTKTIKTGQGFLGDPVPGLQANTNYFLRLTCLVADLKCSASVSYDGPYVTISENVSAAGLRVSKLISKASASEPPIIWKYYYSNIQDMTKSSGKAGPQPSLFKDTYFVGLCDVTTYGFKVYECRNRVAYSSSQVNQFPYSQNYIYYSSVIEGQGENFEAGGTQHTYIIDRDRRSIPIYGNTAELGIKLSNSGVLNGLEKEQLLFKLNGTTFVPVKKTVNSYKIDPGVNWVKEAYVINKDHDYPVTTTPPGANEFTGYDIHKYNLYSYWIYQDSTTVYDYDALGNTLITKTSSQYANPLHTQLTRVQTVTSEGSSSEQTYKYPHEMVAEAKDPTGVYAQMVNSHVIQAVTEEKKLVNGVQTSFSKINYGQQYPQQYNPDSVQVQSQSNTPLETRLRFLSYDNKNNPLTLTPEKGARISYKWGYNQQYPIAEIKNAAQNEFYQQDFEDKNVDYDGDISLDSTRVHTGKYSVKISNTATTEKVSHSTTRIPVNLSSGKRYTFSGWVYSDGPSVQLFMFMMKAGETGYNSYNAHIQTTVKNKWTYIRNEFDVPGDVATIFMRLDNNSAGNVWFDDLRIQPHNSSMSTYTYKPLTGMTSSIDERGQTTYYEYDNFQRLQNIKDGEGNILKNYDYHYKP